MKYIFTTLYFFIVFGVNTKAQDENAAFENKLNFYPTINLVIGNPVQDFWSNYSKQALWGFNIDGVIAPFDNARFFEPGVQLEVFPTASSKNTWQGVEVSTNSSFVRLNAITRMKFARKSKITPIIELGYGINLSSAQTSYEIVDKASFFDKVFFDASDEVETKQVKNFNDAGHNFYAAAGFSLYNWLNIQVKYNYSPTIDFVQKEGIKVTDSNINYETTSSKMQMVIVSVGISLEKLLVND